MSKSYDLDQAQHFVRPHLDLNFLHKFRLLADNTSRRGVDGHIVFGTDSVSICLLSQLTNHWKVFNPTCTDMHIIMTGERNKIFIIFIYMFLFCYQGHKTRSSLNCLLAVNQCTHSSVIYPKYFMAISQIFQMNICFISNFRHFFP